MTFRDDVSFRQAQLEDLAVVFDIHVDSVLALCASHYSATQLAAWFEGRSAEKYINAVGEGALWIAEINGDPVGFTEFFPGVISMLFVRGAYAGKGIGRLMLEFALARLHGMQVDAVKLESTLNAQAFYERQGFTKVGEGALSRANGTKLPIVLMERA